MNTSAHSLDEAPSPPRSDSPADATGFGAYLLLAPMTAGRRVLDLWPAHGEGCACLETGGASDVAALSPDALPLPREADSADIVLCLSRFSRLRGYAERRAWLSEIGRVLSSDGFCVLRLEGPLADDGLSGAGNGDPAAPVGRTELLELLGEHFGRVDIVAETPFVGVSFFVPETDEMAINDDLAQLARAPTHSLVFCARGEERRWQLPESLLIPLSGYDELAAAAGRAARLDKELAELHGRLEAEARSREHLGRDRDELQDQMMTLQEKLERQEAVLVDVRSQLERHLLQISRDQAALESLSLARDQAERRAEAADRLRQDQEAVLRRREAEIAALEREVARLQDLCKPRPAAGQG